MIKFKKIVPEAVEPRAMTAGSAAADLVAISMTEYPEFIEYDTGLAFEIPPGWVGILAARSSLSGKDLLLANGIGVLDSDYRNSVKFRFKRIDGGGCTYEVGDRVGQIMVLPIGSPLFEEASELSSTQRGTGGFGSTGN